MTFFVCHIPASFFSLFISKCVFFTTGLDGLNLLEVCSRYFPQYVSCEHVPKEKDDLWDIKNTFDASYLFLCAPFTRYMAFELRKCAVVMPNSLQTPQNDVFCSLVLSRADNTDVSGLLQMHESLEHGKYIRHFTSLHLCTVYALQGF